jgi:carbon monoxide dehydrogenase subunit G
MQFSAQNEINAPIDAAFDVLADFDAIESGARRRKVDISRLDALSEKGPGMSWDIGFKFRGKRRDLIIDLTEFSRPERLRFGGVSTAFAVEVVVSLTALDAGRCKMKTTLEVTPRTLGARLMIQSAKLGKTTLNRKFDKRMSQFAQAIESRVAISGT